MTDERIIEEEEVVILIDEDGSEHEFYLIETIELDKAQYAILQPTEEDEEEETEVIILKIGEDEEGNEIFFEIEDDEEWEKVADAWEEAEREEEEIIKVDSEWQNVAPIVVTEEMSNQNCPFCHQSLKIGTKSIACPNCKTLHHEECWRENRGCTNSPCNS